MTEAAHALIGADILTPDGIVKDHALLHRGGRVDGVVPMSELGSGHVPITLEGGLLAPGFVDLQVNGGGGVMFNNQPDVAALQIMAGAHAQIGATSILPTLITDSPEVTANAISAAIEAVRQGVPGIVGLHLEGPHLAVSRKGAHDAAFIRLMEDADVAVLLEAAAQLPVLKVTLAPESVTSAQIETLTAAGVLVALGHTDASYEVCVAAAKAGARCVTHLFNAQSQMQGRAPGTVGAALAEGEFSAGLIADMIHVHPAMIRNALNAKQGPGEIFLVSDAMATAGSDIRVFELNGREIHREDNRLTLADGTLAGAHLELLQAARNLTTQVDVPFAKALQMASLVPANLIGNRQIGRLVKGALAHVLHIGPEGDLLAVWQNGQKILG
ncbi:N-acetylglucosamine-6-phosphate deacetylase [Ruegeria profundi]|uniref:N-acetylglucosamine-6-phosphate deacetylase n=1 Tax=Ruegeria profundi TaxID=1685378 RepID=UPI003C7ED1F3